MICCTLYILLSVLFLRSGKACHGRKCFVAGLVALALIGGALVWMHHAEHQDDPNMCWGSPEGKRQKNTTQAE